MPLKVSWLLLLLLLCLHPSYSLKRRCLQPLKEGRGKGYMRNWFFNSTSETCQKFIYFGGARNANNFESRARCRKVCLGQ